MENVILDVGFKEQMCSYHKPMNAYLNFHQFQDACRELNDSGEEQTKCPDCGYWLFDFEIGNKNNINNGE